MTPQEFDEMYSEFIDFEDNLMGYKRTEYSTDLDRLENFKDISKFTKSYPAKVAMQYLLKHIHSIVLAVETQNYKWYWEEGTKEGLKQRIADARNYLILLAGCIEDDVKDKKLNAPKFPKCRKEGTE